MSKYYDIDKPFSIENWNTLIEDVNDILQSPPGGGSGDCQPVEPLDTVEDPRLWSVTDVQQVRGKLQETCAGLTFTEELEIWRPEIIDEIESQMENVWCDCETEPEIISCGSHDQTLLKAGYSTEKCCGNVVEGAPCACGNCHRTTYQGEWYPSVYQSNADTLDAMWDPYTEAAQANGTFIGSINQILGYAANINKWQGYVDHYAGLVDANIAYYEAHCKNAPPEPNAADCAERAQQIGYDGDSARYYQDKLDAELVKWNEKYAIAMAKKEEANAAAATYWALALSLEGRYPDDINFISECFDDALQGLDWYKWFNPYRDSNLTEVRPDVRVWTANPTKYGEGYGVGVMSIYLTADGTPYSTPTLGGRYVHRYTLTYYESKFETRGWPDCSWNTVHDFEPIYYQDNDWSIWAPLPEPDPADYGTTTVKIEITRPPAAGQDNTEKQDEWFATYETWYDEHPQYDDRHENY